MPLAQNKEHTDADVNHAAGSMGGTAHLSICGVSKSFSQDDASPLAVKELSLNFSPAQFSVILGPSGCGKTTLLNIIAGILQPSRGQLLLKGRNITSLPPEKRNFGMVFQNYALFPNLTVSENIAYGLAKAGRNERQHRVRELLDLVGLAPEARRFPAELSGGQQQRVALARALAPNPELLLLDEPLSALDAQVRMTLGQELLKIQRQAKVTTIMVTHDQQEALSLADCIVLMRQGQIEQQGTPAQLYNHPASRFVAEFIGHMNIIRLPSLAEGRTFGIRYEDVRVSQASELALAKPHTFVAKVERSTLLGSFYRVELLLNDFVTRLYADIPSTSMVAGCAPPSLMAVHLPSQYWRFWDE